MTRERLVDTMLNLIDRLKVKKKEKNLRELLFQKILC